MAKMDGERVLDLWAQGLGQGQIAAMIGCFPNEVGALISKARERGDRRAVRRDAFAASSVARQAFKASQIKGLTHAAKLRCAARFPASIDELIRVARESPVPVTKCPPGVHCGWRPRWL